MKAFKRHQIKEVERARTKLIEQIEMFEDGAKYVTKNYLIAEPDVSIKPFSLAWIDEVKHAVNNIDLKNNRIGQRKVTNEYGIDLTMAMLEYIDEITKPIRHQFESYSWKSTPLLKIIAEYHRELTYILIV